MCERDTLVPNREPRGQAENECKRRSTVSKQLTKSQKKDDMDLLYDEQRGNPKNPNILVSINVAPIAPIES